MRGGHFDQSLADREDGIRPVFRDEELARHDLGDQALVLGIDPHLSLDRRQRDHVHVVGEDDRLRCDDFKLQRFGHDQTSAVPFSLDMGGCRQPPA